MKDSRKRSILKSLLWRGFALTNAFVVTWIFIGEWSRSAGVAITANIISFIAYYFHERFWSNVKWGKEESNDTGK